VQVAREWPVTASRREGSWRHDCIIIEGVYWQGTHKQEPLDERKEHRKFNLPNLPCWPTPPHTSPNASRTRQVVLTIALPCYALPGVLSYLAFCTALRLFVAKA
jgi:hypothetical protein